MSSIALHEPWYKNAIIYAVDVSRFMDSNGDGIGDFGGLIQQLDYISDLGVTCVWLLPFYPSPFKDNGYDIENYYGIDPQLGTFDDFLTFVKKAGERSIRVMIDMVLNHTSDTHPWFIAARHDCSSHFRNYYSWEKHPPPVPAHKGSIFPGEEKSVWTFDEISGTYYYHRFYHFEPSLNISHPAVQEEIRRILDFWMSFGVSGFRIDAAPHLISAGGAQGAQPRDPHGIIKDMRAFVASRHSDVALLAEADVASDKLASFFGDNDEFHLLFNFLLNNYLFHAMACQNADSLRKALIQLPEPTDAGQWANFLRNFDELDLEQLVESDREAIMAQFAPEESMKIYGRGIRRRLAPMLQGNRHRMELAFSLLFSLPGTPVFVFGDEIGIGEDLSQAGRAAVRVPMQWSHEKNGGFSTAEPSRLIQPVNEKGPFSFETTNVASQQEDPASFLQWIKRLIQTRRICPEFGYGTWRLMETGTSDVLIHRCTWKDGIVVVVHNLSDQKKTISLDLADQRGRQLNGLFGDEENKFKILKEGTYEIELSPFGYDWFRVTGEKL